MKIFVIRYKSFLAPLLVLAFGILILIIVNFSGGLDIGVFAPKREIPVYSVEMTEKKASLTFDCAWGADDIAGILNTLKAENVKATFFIVGQWAEKYPDSVKMIAQHGHDIGNHSLSHFRMGILDREKINDEIAQCGILLEKLSAGKCDLFRAPYGDYNNNVITEAQKLGYFTIQWDVDSLDWKPGISQENIMQRVTSKIRPGSIILFHNDTKHTAELLPEIILELKAKGYELVPVSGLIIRENYFIDNEGRQKKAHHSEGARHAGIYLSDKIE